MRTAEFVRINYDTEEIRCAIDDILSRFYPNSEELSINQLPLVEAALEVIMQGQLTDRVQWQTPGLTFEFSGFPPAVLRAENERIIASPRAPHVILEETTTELEPPKISLLQSVVEKGVASASNDHPVQLERGYPITIVRFPVESFATSIEVMEVPLLLT